MTLLFVSVVALLSAPAWCVDLSSRSSVSPTAKVDIAVSITDLGLKSTQNEKKKKKKKKIPFHTFAHNH
jgi:hypothetical protein